MLMSNLYLLAGALYAFGSGASLILVIDADDVWMRLFYTFQCVGLATLSIMHIRKLYRKRVRRTR